MNRFKAKKELTIKHIEDLFGTKNCHSFSGRVSMDIQRPSFMTRSTYNADCEPKCKVISADKYSIEHADFPVHKCALS